MTAHHVYVLSCDVEDCDEGFAANSKRADETRAIAAKRGWVHGVVLRETGGPSRSVDYCKLHASELGALVAKIHARPIE